MVLTLDDGKRVKLRLSDVTGARRMTYPAALQERLGGQLEQALSARRCWIDRVLGQQVLYSASGERIHLHRWAFDPSDVRRILEVLGIERRNLA